MVFSGVETGRAVAGGGGWGWGARRQPSRASSSPPSTLTPTPLTHLVVYSSSHWPLMRSLASGARVGLVFSNRRASSSTRARSSGPAVSPRCSPEMASSSWEVAAGAGGWVGAGERARASGACLPPPLLHHRPRPWRSLAAPLHHRPGSAALARTASGWGSLRLPGGLDAGEAAGRGAIEMGRSLRACGPPWRCAPPLHRLACCLGAPAGR